jgi:hypothetical protein
VLTVLPSTSWWCISVHGFRVCPTPTPLIGCTPDAMPPHRESTTLTKKNIYIDILLIYIYIIYFSSVGILTPSLPPQGVNHLTDRTDEELATLNGYKPSAR